MRRPGILALILASVLEAGCLVQIDHVSDPRPAFRQARGEALRYQGKPGPAHELNVLVYDPGDREMVRVSIPMWLARRVGRRIDLDGDVEIGGDDREERVVRRVGRHVRLEDVEKAGLGILAEVEDDDGSQVLVWIR